MGDVKYAVIGAGAVGAVVAEALHQGWEDEAAALADRTRIEGIAQSGGILINGRNASFRLVPFDEPRPLELAVFAVKGYQLGKAMEQAAPWISPKTRIISLLNGITSEQQIEQRFPGHDLPLALTVGQDALRRGTSITYANRGKIILGEKQPPCRSSRVAEIISILEAGGITCEVPDDMVHAMWWKFMVNVGINQVSALCRAPYGEFQKPGMHRDMMLAAVSEVQYIARLEGVSLTSADVAAWLDLLDTLDPLGETSMLQDVKGCRNTEIELFSGTLLRLAEKHGAEVPMNAELYRGLKKHNSDT